MNRVVFIGGIVPSCDAREKCPIWTRVLNALGPNLGILCPEMGGFSQVHGGGGLQVAGPCRLQAGQVSDLVRKTMSPPYTSAEFREIGAGVALMINSHHI